MTSSRGQAGAQSEYAAEYERETGYPPDSRQAQLAAEQGRGAGAMAGSVLAGFLMIIGGAIGFLDGLAMVVRGSWFVYHAGYYYHGTTYSWGWASLILGGLVFVAGVCVILGMMWARIVGVVVATLSAVTHFLIIPYYPLWSLVVIAVNIFIIWALLAWRPRRYA
ncbi:MAG TPA: hypothetical protein VEL03_16375 [Streptosporangiaceae bacterium]|nr:hypothetical protein [Streptosporangiaceae bacterium]